MATKATGIITYTPHIEIVREDQSVGILTYTWNNRYITAQTLRVACEKTGTLIQTQLQTGIQTLVTGVQRGGFGVVWEREDVQKKYLQTAFKNALIELHKGFYHPLKRDYHAQIRGETMDKALQTWRRTHSTQHAA